MYSSIADTFAFLGVNMFLSGLHSYGELRSGRHYSSVMPYVRRSADGAIRSLHRENEAEAHEFLPDEHPEVQAFVGNAGGRTARDTFDRLDADFVRVTEDVVNTLIAKNLIALSDLPAEAQAKLLARKSFRDRFNKNLMRLSSAPGFVDALDDTQFGQLR